MDTEENDQAGPIEPSISSPDVTTALLTR